MSTPLRLPAVIAICLLLPGMATYWIAVPFVCFDVCPSNFGASALFASGLTLGPGLLVAGVTCLGWLLSAHGTHRWRRLVGVLTALALLMAAESAVMGGRLLPTSEVSFNDWAYVLLLWCVFILFGLSAALFYRVPTSASGTGGPTTPVGQ
jgi:hypothetical protein